MGPREGVLWGCKGVPREAAQGRSSVGLRRGVAVQGCPRAQRGAANGAQRGAA